MGFSRIAEHPPFSECIEGFRKGTSSPRDYLERCVAAIEAHDGAVKAMRHLDLAAAREAADRSSRRYKDGRPLSLIDGMPIGVKDIIDVGGMPSGMNNAIYDGHVAMIDAACIRAAREGGGVIVGKAVTTEFAIARSGPTTNPFDPDRTPGGSSSGSAAGAALGMFAVGFGTQTQGSTLRPASYCGVVGLKPTLHAISTEGVHPVSRSHDHVGLLGDSIADVWALARWVSEGAASQDTHGLSGPLDVPPTPQPVARLALLRTSAYDELSAADSSAFEAALDGLRAKGVAVVGPEDDPALRDVTRRMDQVIEKSTDMIARDMRYPFLGYMADHADKLGARIHELMERAQGVPRALYNDHLLFRDDLRGRVAALADSYDAFVLPASSGPAPKGLEYTGSRSMPAYWTFIGFPAYSLPVMRVDGLPFGLQLAGFAGADHRLTRQALWVMAALS